MIETRTSARTTTPARTTAALALGAAALAIAWLVTVEVPAMSTANAQADPAQDRMAGIPAAEERLKAAAAAKKLPFPLEKVTLRVEKAARRLTLLSSGKALRTFTVGLGRTPKGHKAREGDGRTPEGAYYLCTRNDKSRYHLFLGISYPGPGDAEAALAQGRIDAAVAASVTAVKSPDQPPWKTPLGGEVGIHGRGSKKDWTAGCVALEDADMDEVWVACPLGTPITLVP